MVLRTAVTLLTLVTLSPVVVLGQSTQDSITTSWELGAYGSWRWLSDLELDIHNLRAIGITVERVVEDHVSLWGAVQHYEPYDACVPETPGPCVLNGWTAYTGTNLSIGDRKGLVPYLSLGVGIMSWNDGEFEEMWIVRPGLSFIRGTVRPRIELGWERHLSFGFTLGVDVGL